MNGPNPIRVFLSLMRARRTRPPLPAGSNTVDHHRLAPILASAAVGGIGDLQQAPLDRYLTEMSMVNPDRLAHHEALAFWLNVYNAGALALARRAYDRGTDTVLRIPGGFSSPLIEIAGEALSLDDIEHGKVRRFGDPRIHAALVCGSVSCPTLRRKPYSGAQLNAELEDQMNHFLASGGVVPHFRSGKVQLSRVFRWYGGDFVRPHRMPTLIPVRKRAVLTALLPWLGTETADWVDRERPSIAFQRYDWGLACSVRSDASPDPGRDGR